jgi:hypothetical protein
MGYTPPYLEVRKVTGGYEVSPPLNASGDVLSIKANLTDAYPKIVMNGDTNIYFVGNTIETFRFYNALSHFFTIGNDAPNAYTFLHSTVNGYDLYLVTTGAGVLRFGTYAAVPGVSAGYITIKDSAGNLRKLMVQA